MAYAVCLRASIVQAQHWRDNTLTGKVSIEGKEYTFKTRGHIAKAINAIYSDISWKPAEGDQVIIDGDIHGENLIIDQLEPWQPQDYLPIDRHPDLQQRLVEAAASLPEMTKTLRNRAHDDDGFDVRILRWMKSTKAQQGRGTIECMVSAIIAEGDIRFALRNRSGGALLPPDSVAILPILAQTLGIPRATFKGQSKKAPVVKASGNPNKWRPGVPYKPEGMPETDVFDDNSVFDGPVYDDIPF